MKKYFTLMVLAIFGGLLMMSCEMNEVVDRDIQDNDTYPVMKDVTGTFSSTNNYALDQAIDIPSSDVVLVYRNINSNSSASAIWQLLPKTFYLSDNRELDYNFIFDTKRVQVRTEANFGFLLSGIPGIILLISISVSVCTIFIFSLKLPGFLISIN